MFGDLIQSITDAFSDVLPHHLCVSCFLEGLAKGFVVGAAAGALMALIAAASPVLAVILAVAGVVVGAIALVNLLHEMKSMNDAQKSAALGNLIGSLAGGAAGARAVASIAGESSAVAAAEAETRAISTPYGDAIQSMEPEALAARTDVEQGATLYRVGTLGKSQTGEAQFWSLEDPATPGYAARYGIPPENVENANFIETATLPPGTKFVTRPAPAVGPNPGGGIEVVVPPGSAKLQTFNMK